MLRIKKALYLGLCTLLTGLVLGLPVAAGLPPTGDGSGAMLPVVYGLIGLGVVLVVVYILLLRKKK